MMKKMTIKKRFGLISAALLIAFFAVPRANAEEAIISSSSSGTAVVEKTNAIKLSAEYKVISQHYLIGKNVLTSEDFKRNFQNSEFIATLISENCSEMGDTISGSSNCQWRYSDGSKSIMQSRWKTNGSLLHKTTTIRKENFDGVWLNERVVNHYTQFAFHGTERIVESEIYDIEYHFVNGAKTREKLKYYYYPQSGKGQVKTMTWTKYEETFFEKMPRDISYHSVLSFEENGKPLRGFADRWLNGRKLINFLSWDSAKNGENEFNKQLWYQWEKWIRNGFLHVYLI